LVAKQEEKREGMEEGVGLETARLGAKSAVTAVA